MTTQFQPPADPTLSLGGPHWRGCERMHTACAYQLGIAHRDTLLGREIDQLLAACATPDDGQERQFALAEARAIVRRLAGLPHDATLLDSAPSDTDVPRRRTEPPAAANHWPSAFARRDLDLDFDELDRRALHGAAADEANSAWFDGGTSW